MIFALNRDSMVSIVSALPRSGTSLMMVEASLNRSPAG
jgi:hypothetical protein